MSDDHTWIWKLKHSSDQCKVCGLKVRIIAGRWRLDPLWLRDNPDRNEDIPGCAELIMEQALG